MRSRAVWERRREGEREGGKKKREGRREEGEGDREYATEHIGTKPQ